MFIVVCTGGLHRMHKRRPERIHLISIAEVSLKEIHVCRQRRRRHRCLLTYSCRTKTTAAAQPWGTIGQQDDRESRDTGAAKAPPISILANFATLVSRAPPSGHARLNHLDGHASSLLFSPFSSSFISSTVSIGCCSCRCCRCCRCISRCLRVQLRPRAHFLSTPCLTSASLPCSMSIRPADPRRHRYRRRYITTSRVPLLVLLPRVCPASTKYFVVGRRQGLNRTRRAPCSGSL